MPTLSVNTVIVDSGRVLLIRRTDIDVWALPGGGVDPGESIAEAAVREAREETGMEIRIDALVGIYSKPHWRDGGDHAVTFRCTHVSGTPSRRRLCR